MKIGIAVSPKQLLDVLLEVAVVRPVFIWGPPGIGKSSIVQQFAGQVGLECVSMLGSQLAPEDIIGVPQIIDGKSRFCPPTTIARDAPYCLFLDELNACSHEVQKAFYSLIHDRRLGEYALPEGSVVIGAGNRAQDSAIVKPMSSALVNRMVHVELHASHRDWLEWAMDNEIHPWILDYLKSRPDHLWAQPPKTEEPFTTPRSWHIMSDALRSIGDNVSDHMLKVISFACLSNAHAVQFQGFVKLIHSKYTLSRIISGEEHWPDAAGDRDVLYFLALAFRAHLIKNLPREKEGIPAHAQSLAHQGKALLKQLSLINPELAQLVVAKDPADEGFPDWFLIEIARDLPRIVVK